MNEDIQFLKDLQNELNTQENDGQAAPRFWTIMDYKWEPTSEDHADRVILYDSDTCKTVELDDYINEIITIDGERRDYFSEDEVDELEDLKKYGSPSELYDWIKEYDDDSRYYPIYQQEVSFIAWNTLFFTKQEAKNHLKANAHHYSEKAHTFAMTAWRAPKMERLMKILETFDWHSVNV